MIALVGIVLGVALVVAGGADDSPGLQGLGLLVVLASSACLARTLRRRAGGGTRS